MKQSVNLANLPAGPNLHRFSVFIALKIPLYIEKCRNVQQFFPQKIYVESMEKLKATIM